MPAAVTKKDLLAEGKTKKIFSVNERTDVVLVESKDKLTAFGGAKSHELEGKARLATLTTCKVFEFLRSVGIKSHYVEQLDDVSFLARKCDMIPIEFVIRRVATGSFLKRHVNVKEGYRFHPPKVETFFKDDAQNDPEWSFEEVGLLTVKLPSGTRRLDSISYLDQMLETSRAVFECLEHAWASKHCALIDMKIEFGIDVATGEVVLADVIDNDSWRLWPRGDARLMKDKEVYRQMASVTPEGLTTLIKNFTWVAERCASLLPRPHCRVIIMMGSESDMAHCEKIKKECLDLGIGPVIMHVASAHKTTRKTLDIVAQYEGDGVATVVIAVAGRSNGLGPVLSANTTLPVINCPPFDDKWTTADIWSSLRVPSGNAVCFTGLGCSTVLYPQTAALQAAKNLGLTQPFIWCKVRGKLLQNQLDVFRCNDDLAAKALARGSPEMPEFPFDDEPAGDDNGDGNN